MLDYLQCINTSILHTHNLLSKNVNYTIFIYIYIYIDLLCNYVINMFSVYKIEFFQFVLYKQNYNKHYSQAQ